MTNFDELDRRFWDADKLFDKLYWEKKNEITAQRVDLERQWKEMEQRDKNVEAQSTTIKRMYNEALRTLEYMRLHPDSVSDQDEWNIDAAATNVERELEGLREI